MSVQIVVAHYKESLDWLNIFRPETVLVYNKNNETTRFTTINLPNLGRESNTYLHHIIHNYDTLPDIVAFMQGKDDHLPAYKLRNYIKKMKETPSMLIEGDITMVHKSNIFLSPDGRIYTWQGKDLIPAECGFFSWFQKYIDSKLPEFYPIIWGACFVVRRETIRAHSLEFYKRLYEQTLAGDSVEVGHFFERTWGYIFTHKGFT